MTEEQAESHLQTAYRLTSISTENPKKLMILVFNRIDTTDSQLLYLLLYLLLDKTSATQSHFCGSERSRHATR